MKKSWFDLRPQIRRTYAQSVWIPLHISCIWREGEVCTPTYRETFEGAHSIVVPQEKRELGENYSWSDNRDPRPWAEAGFYKPADIYSLNQDTDIGFRLALRQSVAGHPDLIWHLHQDFVLALELLREGDRWVRPTENYVEVARLRRDAEGGAAGIEVRIEFLRDYLCARNCALRIASYRQRSAVLDNLDDIDFPAQPNVEHVHGGRLEERAWAIDSSGSPFGSSVAVFKVSRNDIDPDDDVPIMGPETNENVDSTSWSFKREKGKSNQVMAEFWRDEWIEPAARSPRVRQDHVPSQVTYIIDADGTRANADDLDEEDIGRWLWFSPGVVVSFLARRGCTLKWHTRDTGSLWTSSDSAVHFGINESGLITVYAYDVAKLPEWEKRLWGGFNVAPEGKVSAELLSAQVYTRTADSQAPEAFFALSLQQLDIAWKQRYKTSLIRHHDQSSDIAARIHRFRAIDHPGLLALAKDIARLTADSIDASAARAIAPPAKGENFGSLKSLERALATICGNEAAHRAVGPLFAVYDLRLSDAHLPQSDLQGALGRLGIAEGEPPLDGGYKMLHATVSSLCLCSDILRATPE